MLKIPGELASSRSKFERAELHFGDLAAHFRTLLSSNPGKDPRTTFEHHPERAYDVIRIHFAETEIVRASLLMGDVAHNLRCALDHIAWAFYCRHYGSATPPPNTRIAFPIFNDHARYQAEAPKKMVGFPKDASDVVERLQPYHSKTPNDLGESLWRLHFLNNRDKHHHLNVVGFKVDGSQVNLAIPDSSGVDLQIVPIRFPVEVINRANLNAELLGVPRLPSIDGRLLHIGDVRMKGYLSHDMLVEGESGGLFSLKDASAEIMSTVRAIISEFGQFF